MASKYPGLAARIFREMNSPSCESWSCTGLMGCWTRPSGVSGSPVTVPVACTPDSSRRARSTSAWCLATSAASAFADGGLTPYPYSWSGVLSGSGQTVIGEVGNSGWLYVTATDWLASQNSDSFFVTVDAQAPWCEF